MRVWVQWGYYICSYWLVWLLPLVSSSYLCLIRVSEMFANIPEIEITIGIAFVAVLFVLGLVQYSRFIEHRKKHKDDELGTEKFAVIPYLAVPILGAVVAVCIAAIVTDLAVMKGYMITSEGIAFWNAVMAIIAYALLDHYLIGHIGDAVYYTTIESKVADIAKSVTETDDIDEKVKAALQKLLK